MDKRLKTEIMAVPVPNIQDSGGEIEFAPALRGGWVPFHVEQSVMWLYRHIVLDYADDPEREE